MIPIDKSGLILLTHIAGIGIKILKKSVNNPVFINIFQDDKNIDTDIQGFRIIDFYFLKCCTPSLIADKQIVA